VSSKSAEAFLAEERIARLSVIALVAIGIALIIIGYWTQSLSLRTGASNSIKDGTSSFVAFANVLGASLFGIRELDAVGGMIIAVYIFGVAYAAIKESTLILLDACESPEITSEADISVNDR
jgi:divalent metal cation (Fe/Co/Zn/Cd) transporter